ncbi:eukaryotic translation initiation factor 2C [Enteropsectra breve]|nr:eukaryotic translation initiation factor 2C [Enteropsectra breve]
MQRGYSDNRSDNRGDYRGDSRGGRGGSYPPRRDGPPRPRAPAITEVTPITVTSNLYKYTGKSVALHQYFVSFTPEILRKSIEGKFKMMAEENNFKETYAFDGNNMLVSPNKFKDTTFTREMRDGELICKIEYKSTYDMSDKSVDLSMLNQCLEVVLRSFQRKNFYVEKRKMISPSTQPFDLSSELEIKPGLVGVMKPTISGFYLNLDMVYAVFYKPMKLIDLVTDLADRNYRMRSAPDAGHEFYGSLQRLLGNIRLRTNHRERNMSFKVSGIHDADATKVTFENEDKTSTSVADYFAKTYKSLNYKNLPLLIIKRRENVIYMPIEVCEIIPMQKYSKKLNEMMTSSMIKIAAKRPDERFRQIEEKAREVSALSNADLTEFGLAFDNKMLNCKGKILPAPQIVFGDERSVQVNNGSWNLANVRAISSVVVPEWKIFVFRSNARVSPDLIDSFINLGERYGIRIPQPSIVQIKSVTDFYNEEKGKFNLVVLPDKNAQRYEEVKRIAETYAGCYTQCLVASNVVKLSNPAFASNLLLKINTKLGGSNWRISTPLLKDKKTILFGIDVNHPGIGDIESPSIAAVVASLDYDFIKYKTTIIQNERSAEIVHSLKDTVKAMLKAHYGANKAKPERIIVFRDGVGDSMFDAVYEAEIGAFRAACAELGADYHPEINFVLGQKRHSVRFSYEQGNQFNCIPGTVIDDENLGLVNKAQTDFFMVSHNALQGTARPIRYVVLLNESKFSNDAFHEMVYGLCHLYMRATKAVSVVPPIYYAHLAAARGKCYLEKNNDGAVVMRACDKNIEKTLYYV